MACRVYDHETGLPLDHFADPDLARESRGNVEDGSALAYLGNDRLWHHVLNEDHEAGVKIMGYDVRKVWVE